MDANTPVPGNILRFEALLYASLIVDCFSAAFNDVSPAAESADKLAAAASIGLFVWLTWYGANRRKRWARTFLCAVFIISVVFIAGLIRTSGLTSAALVEVLSLGLAGAGLYFSFTGDAVGWFKRSNFGRPT